MKTVWVVSRKEKYEEPEIAGIYTTEEEAEKAASDLEESLNVFTFYQKIPVGEEPTLKGEFERIC